MASITSMRSRWAALAAGGSAMATSNTSGAKNGDTLQK
jgi:hypothetical protein